LHQVGDLFELNVKCQKVKDAVLDGSYRPWRDWESNLQTMV